MFCDSDDEFERHACKNLLQAAEQAGADVVCGTAERVDVRSGRTRRWRPELHDRLRVADDLADLPELLYDTISVNKIYRTELLRRNDIRFPEGLLFEDQLFTLEAMAAAQRLATIPETVYRWYVDRLSDEPSITQRRNEAHNVESRIEINRRIDAFLAKSSTPRLKEVKDLKFLKHDLYLYLASMLEVDDETAGVLIDRLVPYVQQVELGPAWQLRPALRVAIYHLLVRDLDGIRSAMRFLKWASVVDAPIVADGAREQWGSPHLAGGPDANGVSASAWLDVTDLHLLSIPFTQRRYLHRLHEISITGSRIRATGSTVDFDGQLASVDGIELRVLINGDRTALSVPAAWTGFAGGRREWRVDGELVDHLGRRLEAKDRGTVAMALTRGDHVNTVSMRSPEADVTRIRMPFPGRAHWIGPDAVELVPYDNGAIGWRSVRASAVRTSLASARSWWFRLPGATTLGRAAELARRDWVPAVVARLGTVLPRRRLAVFEAGQGRAFGGNVAAISRVLADVRPDYAQAWVFRSTPERVPLHARGVERLSLRHAWLLARASLFVDDGLSSGIGASRALKVNAGDGVPIHRLGLDDPSVLVSRASVAAVRRRAREWDLLVSPSAPAAATTSRAFGYRGQIAISGLARADEGVTARSGAAPRAQLRQALDLPTDRMVILYAPTGRHAGREPREALIDLDRWARELGDRAYLLVRPHPTEAIVVPTRLRSAVRDIGGADDLDRFVAASDLFISDYSSVIGDAALLDLPIVLFQPDREIFVNRTRGLYPAAGQAGPIVEDLEGLFLEVRRGLDDPATWDREHGPRRRAWADEWCGPADGLSTQRAVDLILATEEAT
jgi:CDP-glycerol glycerophosphotransferase